MPITPPKIDIKRQLARRLIESVVTQFTYFGAPMVALYSVTYRSQAEKVLEKWQHDVTDKVNSLEQTIKEIIPTICITDEASALAVAMARGCNFGHGKEYYKLEALLDDFPNATIDEIVELCGELIYLGLAKKNGLLGKEIDIIWPKIELFEIFDGLVFEGRNPRADAGILADYIAENKELSSKSFIDEFDWPLRRYNPAMAIVCKMIGGGRVSRTKSSEFYSEYCFSLSEERAALRQFAQSVKTH